MTATATLGTRLFLYTVAAAAIAGASASHARAAAFYLQDQSVRGLGRAYAGEVADVGADSLWWNPAAIAGSGNELTFGANAVLIHSKVSDQGSTITRPVPPAGLTTPVGGSPRAFDPVENGLVPNFAVAIPIGSRFAVGLSAAAPFDFTSQFSPSAFARYDGLTSRLTTEDLQLTGAAQVTSWLDVGAGFDAAYASANLSQSYPNLSPLLPDGQSDLRGGGWSYGYVVGARAHAGAWSVGASYRSQMKRDLEGSSTVSGLLGPLAVENGRAPGSASFKTPWIATLGARYRLTQRLTLDAQVERFGWSEFAGISIVAGGASTYIPTTYRDTTSGAVGLDFVVDPRLTLRAGVGYDQTPTINGNRSALVPDSDRQLYTLGASVRATRRMTVDAGFGYIAFQGARVNNAQVFYAGTPAQTVANERGTVSGEAEVLSVAVRYAY